MHGSMPQQLAAAVTCLGVLVSWRQPIKVTVTLPVGLLGDQHRYCSASHTGLTNDAHMRLLTYAHVCTPAALQGPVVMDMATAAYAWFGLLEAKTAGRPIPGDVALNAQGQATTDPNEVLSGGAIRVFDR
jgi:hypothetical protein